MSQGGYVYIMSNATGRVLYTGVTSGLVKRVWEHKNDIVESSFTSRYKVHKLVYFERHGTIEHAIEREKQIKAGSRKKKVELVESRNPEWKDLYEDLL